MNINDIYRLTIEILLEHIVDFEFFKFVLKEIFLKLRLNLNELIYS